MDSGARAASSFLGPIGRGLYRAAGMESRTNPMHMERAPLATILVEFKDKDAGNTLHLSTMQAMIPKLHKARLETQAFFGAEVLGKKRVYLLITCPEARLLEEAAERKWLLPLDPAYLMEADKRKNKELAARGFQWDPKAGGRKGETTSVQPDQADALLTIPNPRGVFRSRNPYQHIFAEYREAKKEYFYVSPETGSVLRQTDALQLLRAIIEEPDDGTPAGGADVHLERLVAEGRCVRWTPVHDEKGREALARAWLGYCCTFRQPLPVIAGYMGERIAMHFAFTNHLTLWLILPALIGTGIFAHQVVSSAPGVGYLPAFAVFTAVWVTLTLEFWKRKQSRLSMEFGMSAWEEKEPLRPEFIANPSTTRQRSFVTGAPTYWSSPGAFRSKLAASSMITLTAIGVVIAIVVSIFILRVLLTLRERKFGGSIPDGYGNHITSILNAVQVQVMDVAYASLARRFTDWENHATPGSYDNSLVVKMALFYSINAFFPLLWIAAIKNYVTINGQSQACPPNKDGLPDCLPELQTQLGIMLVSRMLIGYVTGYAVPYVMKHGRVSLLRFRGKGGAVDAATIAQQERDMSGLQADALKPDYDVFKDYLDHLIGYGFYCLFVVAFPLAPMVQLISNLLEARLDAYKVVRLFSRPKPKGAASIGAWQMCFEGMTMFAVIVNCTICVFTDVSPIFGRSLTTTERLTFFVIAEHMIFGLKFALAEFIPDVSYSTSLQLERTEYLVDKHIKDVADDPISEIQKDAQAGDGEGSSFDGVSDGVEGGGGGDGSRMVKGVLVHASYWSMTGQVAPSTRLAGGAPVDPSHIGNGSGGGASGVPQQHHAVAAATPGMSVSGV